LVSGRIIFFWPGTGGFGFLIGPVGRLAFLRGISLIPTFGALGIHPLLLGPGQLVKTTVTGLRVLPALRFRCTDLWLTRFRRCLGKYGLLHGNLLPL
jgi:hypothetical protein